MKKIHLALSLLLGLIITNASANNTQDLVLVNINQLGYEQTHTLKNLAGVSFWVELGAEMLLGTKAADDLTLPATTTKIQVMKSIDIDLLYLEVNGICHSHLKHTEDQQTDAKNSSLYIQDLYGIRLAASIQDKQDLLAHNSCFRDLTPDTTVVAQAANLKQDKNKSTADPNVIALLDQVDQTRWLDHVKFLSSHNRLYKNQLEITGNWLFDKFQNLGLSTTKLGSPTEYYVGFNVIGVKQGTTRPDDWYVVGAHLDSFNNNYLRNAADALAAPGAEDNASGCSGVLEMAEILSQYESEATIIFVCFAGHETNKLSFPISQSSHNITNGSVHMVDAYRQAGDFDKIKAMLNMDMISFHNGLGEHSGLVSTAHEAVSLELRTNFLEKAALYSEIPWSILPILAESDHNSFSRFGVPAIMSSETTLRQYSGYHNSGDIWQNLDPYQASQVIKTNLATLADLAGVVTGESSGQPITSAHSGLWYNQAQSGHGYTVLVLPDNRINLQWYVYDNQGNQAWLIGTGTYEENSHQATVDMAITDNGFFPPNFDADEVSIALWGTLTIEFDGCHSGLATWQPTDDYSQYAAGSMPVTRLASMKDLTDCTEQ